MDDSKETFLSNLNERFNSQFFVTYLFYVLILNWRAFGYLVNPDLILTERLVDDEGNILSKLDYIQSQFYAWSSFIVPFLAALGSVIIFPIINWAVSAYKHEIKIRKENRFKAREFGDLTRTTEEYRKLEKERSSLYLEYKDAIENKNQIAEDRNEKIQTIGRLEVVHKELQNTYERYKKETSDDKIAKQNHIQQLQVENRELEEANNHLRGDIEEWSSDKKELFQYSISIKNLLASTPNLREIEKDRFRQMGDRLYDISTKNEVPF